MPNWDQVKGVADRLVAMLLTFAVAKGWITPADVTTYAALAIGLLSVAWGVWVNRDKALLQSAATVVGPTGIPTTIITSREMAAATPESNIVSSPSPATPAKK